MTNTKNRHTLPEYVVFNDPSCPNPEVLKRPAESVTFPLDRETQEIISHLEAKFDQEENCAGLAAPQIGYGKRIIVLEVPDDEELKKYRPDLSDTLPKSIFINPSYKGLGEDKTIDWEACFSVGQVAAKVARFTEITYEAWTPEGKKISGKAKGFLARLLQHEIDHTDGKLFIDHVSEEELVTFEEMRKRRARGEE
jgi:peptide deformylase